MARRYQFIFTRWMGFVLRSFAGDWREDEIRSARCERLLRWTAFGMNYVWSGCWDTHTTFRQSEFCRERGRMATFRGSGFVCICLILVAAVEADECGDDVQGLVNNCSSILLGESPSAVCCGLIKSAVKTFIRSQIEHCSELKVSVSGNNSDLFQGRVRSLKISAKGAVYKGIYLTDVQLAASDIKLKLRASRILQEPSNVRASIRVDEEDLSSSLACPLLGKALQKLLSERFHVSNNAPDTYLRFKDGAVQLQKKSLLKNVRFSRASINNTKEYQKTAGCGMVV